MLRSAVCTGSISTIGNHQTIDPEKDQLLKKKEKKEKEVSPASARPNEYEKSMSTRSSNKNAFD